MEKTAPTSVPSMENDPPSRINTTFILQTKSNPSQIMDKKPFLTKNAKSVKTKKESKTTQKTIKSHKQPAKPSKQLEIPNLFQPKPPLRHQPPLSTSTAQNSQCESSFSPTMNTLFNSLFNH